MREARDEIVVREDGVDVPDHRPRLPHRIALWQLLVVIALIAVCLVPLTRWHWNGPSRASVLICERDGEVASVVNSPPTLEAAHRVLHEWGRPVPKDLLDGVTFDQSHSDYAVVCRLTGRPQEDADVANALAEAYIRTKPRCSPWCGKTLLVAQPPKRVYLFDDTILLLMWSLNGAFMVLSVFQWRVRSTGPSSTRRPLLPVAGVGDDPQR